VSQEASEDGRSRRTGVRAIKVRHGVLASGPIREAMPLPNDHFPDLQSLREQD
jgi:hypothetical protein